MNHSLKIGEERLTNLVHGRKKVEIRVNDRDYQAGDTLQFKKERLLSSGQVVSDSKFFVITHIHSGLGMQDNYVALSAELKQ